MGHSEHLARLPVTVHAIECGLPLPELFGRRPRSGGGGVVRRGHKEEDDDEEEEESSEWHEEVATSTRHARRVRARSGARGRPHSLWTTREQAKFGIGRATPGLKTVRETFVSEGRW